MKKIMILGAGVYQVPLIKKGKEMGLFTIVVSKRGNFPGEDLGDKFLEIDTTDGNQVLIAAKENQIEAITTTGTDVCVPAIGKVVDLMGLPGTGFVAAQKSMDKVLMKNAFKSHAVPTASFEMFRKKEEALEYAKAVGFPIMVKATDSSGSRGITKVNNSEEFNFGWKRAMDVSRSKEILIEEFLSGLEFGAQAFIHGNKVAAVFPHGDTVTPAPFFSPIGHSMPTTLTAELQKETAIVIEKAVQALGIRDCISNVDLMLVNGKVKIIEIGARMGATCLPENVSIYSGIDTYEHLIRLALGEYPEIKITQSQPNACLLLRATESGILNGIVVPESVSKHPSLIDLHFDVKPNDSVRRFQVGPDRLGHIIVTESDPIAAEKLAEELASQIAFRII